MADRVGELIADVQAHIAPPGRLPEGASERWPGIAVLETDAIVESVDLAGELSGSPDPKQRLERVDELESIGVRDDVQYVGFPERVNGQVALDEAEDIVNLDSLDALAFYLPFHFYRRWGIYIRESGILSLASNLATIARANGCLAATPPLAVDYAYRILWAHEFFHYQTEVACARLQHSHPPSAWLYSRYFIHHAAGLEEEGLANAYALKHAKRVLTSGTDRALRQAARSWMKQFGPGYKDFPFYEGGGHAPAKDRQVDYMGERGSTRQSLVFVPGRLLYRSIPASSVPTYLVRDGGTVLSLIRQFPRSGPLRVWAYTNDHKPPHVHTGRGPGVPISDRFEWPSRVNMDNAPARVAKQFNDYADRYSAEIDKKIANIDWK